MDSSVELVGAQAVGLTLKIKTKEYAQDIEGALARFMTETRFDAAEHELRASTAMKNGKVVYNPYIAGKLQHSIDDKLTNRTHKLAYMLRGGRAGYKPNFSSSWSGLNSPNGLKKEQTSGLSGVIRMLNAKHENAYTATYRVNIQMDGILSNTGTAKGINSMPTETRQTLFMRFKHELGLHGKTRQFMNPAANKNESKLRMYIQEAIAHVVQL